MHVLIYTIYSESIGMCGILRCIRNTTVFLAWRIITVLYRIQNHVFTQLEYTSVLFYAICASIPYFYGFQTENKYNYIYRQQQSIARANNPNSDKIYSSGLHFLRCHAEISSYRTALFSAIPTRKSKQCHMRPYKAQMLCVWVTVYSEANANHCLILQMLYNGQISKHFPKPNACNHFSSLKNFFSFLLVVHLEQDKTIMIVTTTTSHNRVSATPRNSKFPLIWCRHYGLYNLVEFNTLSWMK